ncbi:hypothetical protein cypCar_00032178, partial [Cyprinus carpio]
LAVFRRRRRRPGKGGDPAADALRLSVGGAEGPAASSSGFHPPPAGRERLPGHGRPALWPDGRVDGWGSRPGRAGPRSYVLCDNVLEGISVDWPGWCFDDEEVFDFENFEDEDQLTTNEPQ